MKFFVVKPADRFTVVVSKSVSKKAVQRNLIKRRIREAVHTFSTHPRAVFITLPSIVGKSFAEIKTAVAQAMKKI